MIDQSRSEFEAWILKNNLGWEAQVVTRDADGDYRVMSTLLHWKSWQAARESMVPAGAVEKLSALYDSWINSRIDEQALVAGVSDFLCTAYWLEKEETK